MGQKQEFKFVKVGLNLLNSSKLRDSNQDLMVDFQGIFNYQGSIVYSYQ